MKYLVLLVLIIGVLWYFFRPKEKDGGSKDPSLMVECAACGVYVPSTEALKFRGEYYCSKECLDSAKEGA